MRFTALLTPLLAAFVVVLPASALGVPPGFVSRPALATRAAYIAGKPVTVYCPTSQAAWDAFLTAHNDTAMVDVNGLTLTVGSSETYLSPDVCATLLGRINGKAVILDALGASVDVIAHESIHMRGESDEGVTECDAIRSVPDFLVKRWGFRKGSPAYRQTLYGARSFHARLPSQYRTTC